MMHNNNNNGRCSSSSSNTIIQGNDSGPKLPIGFRFRPTDEELLLHYLKPKLLSFPFPSSVIPHHLHLFHSHPSLFLGDCKEKRYFFCKKSWNHFKNFKITTSDGSGYWKAISKDKYILTSAAAAAIIGTKKYFSFYQGIHGLKTQWLMKQFALLPSQTSTYPNHQEMEDWVVFCIYQRKTRNKNKPRRRIEENVIGGRCNNVIADVTTFDTITDHSSPPLPSPSSSSGVSDNVCTSLDQEETCKTPSSYKRN